MNLITKLAVLAGLALGVAQTASAVVITSGPATGTNVGSIDTLLIAAGTLAPCGPGSSDAAELCFVDSNTPGTVSFVTKTESVAYYGTDTANVYALDLSGEPKYFLLKNATDWALYENLPSTGWAVFDASLLPESMNVNGGLRATISHVSEFSSSTTTVPEPATLALFGLALAGLGLAKRRKQG